MTITPLTDGVAAVLAQVGIGSDGITARVGDHELRSDSTQELRKELAGWIYHFLHAGHENAQDDLPFHSRDIGFEQRLFGAVPHRHTRVTVPLLAVEQDSVVVLRDGVRVRVELADGADTSAPQGSTVDLDVPACRPLLSPGFFMVDGTRPMTDPRRAERLYLHVPRPDDAVHVWGSMLGHLEEHQVAYRAKALSSPLLYPRRDTIVAYLVATPDELARFVEHMSTVPGIAPATPGFARRLADGIARADEPADPRPAYRGMSFGQHRAQVLSEALFEAFTSGRPVEDCLQESMRNGNVDPQDFSRNAQA